MGAILTSSDILSRSRGASNPFYYIMTPANLVPNALPFFENTTVNVLVVPRLARFGQYLLDMGAGALTSEIIQPGLENFFYTLEGEVVLETAEGAHLMRAGGYAYLPDTIPFALKNCLSDRSRLLWTKRRYTSYPGLHAPTPIFGHRCDTSRQEGSVAGSWTQPLIPLDDQSYDFAMNLLAFQPGVYFDLVEIHHQEHGLYMIAGQGVYYLAGDFHEVQKDDFIYMAPYCPQYFYVTGWNEAEYLLYKDTNRDGF